MDSSTKTNPSMVALRKALDVGTPLVCIATADQQGTAIAIVRDFEACPIIAWDMCRGPYELNQTGKVALANAMGQQDPVALAQFPDAMTMALRLPAETLVLCFNAHRFIEQPMPSTAILNARDIFKRDGRCLIMLGPDFTLPRELVQDVLVIDEPLPTREEIRESITDLYAKNEPPIVVKDDVLEQASDALTGLAYFPVEQAAAMAVVSATEINVPELWTRKAKMIEQTRGLTMSFPTETFADIGGVDEAKDFITRLMKGRRRPRCVVWIDEIEKAFAGVVGDLSGTSQDQLAVSLNAQEENNWPGLIFAGPPGCTKSMLAKAIAGTFGIPLIAFDLGAMKGGLVGESEKLVRAAVKAVYAIAGNGGALFVATSNGAEKLPPELRRRYRLGLWFFDLPDADERVAIGKLQAQRYGAVGKKWIAPEFWIACDGFSGANIRDACEIAYALDLDLKESVKRIVPAAQQDPDGIERLRKSADGRFLSASYPGTYRLPNKPGQGADTAATARRIAVKK